VDGCHQALDDSELVVDDLGERGQAVGRTGSVGDDGVLGVICLQVDTTDEHWGISRRGGDDDLLGTTLQVSSGPTGLRSAGVQIGKDGAYLSVVVKTPVDSTM